VLLSIQFQIPILHLIPRSHEKVRTTSKSMTTHDLPQIQQPSTKWQNARNHKSLSCTDQWMEKLVPLEVRLAKSCNASCAGLWGKYAISSEQFKSLKRQNNMDLTLWSHHVLPLFQATKQSILRQFNKTQKDLDTVVQLFRRVQAQQQTRSAAL